MPSDLPAHASPALSPISSARPSLSGLDVERNSISPLPSLISPAFTPPQTPGPEDESTIPLRRPSGRRTQSIPVDSTSANLPKPKLVEQLPAVECIVRARIPTTTGTEMFLHLYTNNVDNKEHLAIVFGSSIRSRSLDAERPGETEQDRMIRGAYVGRLYPGRTSSRVSALSSSDARRSSSGKASPLLRGLHKRQRSTSNLAAQEQLPASAFPLPGSREEISPRSREHEGFDPPDPPQEPTSNSHILSNGTLQEPPPQYSAPLVRIHSECYTGETVWSARCDCGEQLDEAARLMSEASEDSAAGPGGVIIYLRQEGRGIGLSEKLKAYNLQDLGSDTYEANILLRHPADARSYGLATAMLVDLGLGGRTGIKLLTNNPDKIRAVEGPGREVVVKERVAMVPLAWKTGGQKGIKSKEVEGYLRAKIEQFGHLLSEPR